MIEQYKKLKFKARRGMLELDLLLQNYLDNNYSFMSDDLKYQFELLMDYSDPELLSWLIMELSPGTDINNNLAEIIHAIVASKQNIKI